MGEVMGKNWYLPHNSIVYLAVRVNENVSADGLFL